MYRLTFDVALGAAKAALRLALYSAHYHLQMPHQMIDLQFQSAVPVCEPSCDQEGTVSHNPYAN